MEQCTEMRVVISGGTYGCGVRHYGGEVKMGKVSGQVTLNEGPHLGDLCVYVRILLKWILKKQE
jgi:hypothetical protein